MNASPTKLHPVTLSFEEPTLDRSFMEHYTERSLQLVRISILLAVVLFLIYHFLDRLIMPEVVDSVLVIRGFVAALLLGAAGLTLHPIFRKNFQLLMSLVVLIGGGGILLLIYVGEAVGGHEYYAGLMLAVIYAHALLRLRFIYATATTWCVIAAYVVMVVSNPTADNILISHVAFLATANVLGMVSSYGLEYYERTVFFKTQQVEERGRALEREHKRKTAELEAIRQLQLSMLPRHPPAHERVDLAVSMTPATEVGGDFYDFHVADDGTLTFAIGDATGHGARAGAMVTATKILFNVLAPQHEVTETVRQASAYLRAVGLPGLYMALAVGRLKGRTLELVGAGLPPALIYRASTETVEEIPLKGVPAGFSQHAPYHSTSVTLSPGDTVAFMTDGFAELRNGHRDMLGYEKVTAIFFEYAAETPDRILAHLRNTVQAWTGGYAQEDDITFLVMRMR